VEDLSKVEEFLSDTMGCWVIIPQLNHSNRSSLGKLHWRSQYTPEMEQNVGDLYASDLKSFKYDV
jgi:hypothetical protein